MKYIINNLKLPLGYTEKDLKNTIQKKTGYSTLNDIKIQKQSIDSRSNIHPPFYILTVEISTDTKIKISADIKEFQGYEEIHIHQSKAKTKTRPIVIGAGPAGLMAALVLAKAKTNPLLVEMGQASEERNNTVNNFWNKKILNPKSNVLFGEGGAGMFSDGKLTSRSKAKPLIQYFFQTLIDAGAPPEIMYDSYPHLGSDLMLKIIPNIRKMIIDNGGEVLFNNEVTDIKTSCGKIKEITLNNQQSLKTDIVFLASGHSARTIYKILEQNNTEMAYKPFAMGVRIEMPQKQIDISQNGKWANKKELQHASFRLTHKANGKKRDCYSFCMCPGGEIIACASAENEIFTNGMSLSARNLKNGNAAFLVPVTSNDYSNKTINAPINFQKILEEKAFSISNNYLMPAQTLNDFLTGKLSHELPEKIINKTVLTDLSEILPDFITYTLKKSIPSMLNRLKAVDMNQCIIYGPETRSSSPLTILRDKNTLESTNTKGLYPCGEGSGYAGGIVSSAIDGIKAALSFSQNI